MALALLCSAPPSCRVAPTRHRLKKPVLPWPNFKIVFKMADEAVTKLLAEVRPAIPECVQRYTRTRTIWNAEIACIKSVQRGPLRAMCVANLRS
jgi:hypothetical protein